MLKGCRVRIQRKVVVRDDAVMASTNSKICFSFQAVKNALGSVFFNKGENCIAAGRIFVEETIYTEFLNRFAPIQTVNCSLLLLFSPGLRDPH
jgi:formyltetrahydrofolate dehydrogenase